MREGERKWWRKGGREGEVGGSEGGRECVCEGGSVCVNM